MQTCAFVRVCQFCAQHPPPAWHLTHHCSICASQWRYCCKRTRLCKLWPNRPHREVHFAHLGAGQTPRLWTPMQAIARETESFTCKTSTPRDHTKLKCPSVSCRVGKPLQLLDLAAYCSSRQNHGREPPVSASHTG